jgi:hypothetical protein
MRHTIAGGIIDLVAAAVFGAHGLLAVSARTGYAEKLVSLSKRYRGFHGLGSIRLVRTSGVLALLAAAVAVVLGAVEL